ncbi:MAG: hypothetical protein UT75_C0004G0001, partial [Candidatus Yanofskybacteria bacterium GW2011_GWE2_40_11]
VVAIVAILAAMNLHGVTQVQHDFAHASDWPAVALIESDHDHPAVHVHVAPEEVPDTDTDRDGDGPIPVGHHHHGGRHDLSGAMRPPRESIIVIVEFWTLGRSYLLRRPPGSRG